MAGKAKIIYVYADWKGFPAPALMGILTATHSKGKEIFAFEYDESWLKTAGNQQLDPRLQLYGGPQYAGEQPNFGIFSDSAPDRWGRVLMKRREAIIARRENRKPVTLQESDFLLGVFDGHRMGAIRFRTDPEGPFLSDEQGLAAPPFTSLRALEQASLKLEDEKPVKDEEALKWLNMLMAPGASLGGARPKASVRDPDNGLWIAKFPSVNDETDSGAWEMVLNELAKRSGIRTPRAMLKKFTSKHHTFLSFRFDREQDGTRLHFASAMTLLGQQDGAGAQEGVSYLDLAGFIGNNGADVHAELEELWRRIVFNIMVKNTDDHLRNHGFILTERGWMLSPAYDMNPVPTGTGLTLNISEHDNSLDPELALSVTSFFRIKQPRAAGIIAEVQNAVAGWRKIAKEFGLTKAEQDAMAEAFVVG